MTTAQEKKLYVSIRIAVLEAIAEIGYDAVKQTSMFPSADCNNYQDNEKSKFVKAA